MKTTTVPTILCCEHCSNRITIHRKIGKQKALNHIKHMWCFRCKDRTPHIEYKQEYLIPKEEGIEFETVFEI